MKYKFLSEKKYRAVINIIFSLFLLFFFQKIFLYHANMVISPYPLEYREGASLMVTDGLVKGINPYALENQPAYTNDYGIFFSAVVYPFAKVFGPTLVVHRAVAAFFLIASFVLLFFVMKKLKIPILWNFCVILLLYTSMVKPGTTTACANPSPLGLFLFLLSIFVPWFARFSYKSLLASIALGILAYYTKPYFMFGVPVIGSYLFLFVSKKKGLVYTAIFLFLATISVLLMHRSFDCYFNNCFFIHTNIRHLYNDVLFNQLKEYARLHAGIFILLPLTIVLTLLNSRNSNSTHNSLNSFNPIQLSPFNHPFLKISCPLTLYSAGCSFILLYFWLGKHSAASWYFFHLFSPFFLIFAFNLFKKFARREIFLLPFFIVNLYLITEPLDYKRLNPRPRMEEWNTLEHLVSGHKNILNSPLIAPLLIEQNKPVYDNGLSEYFKMGAYREDVITKTLFKQDGQVILQYYKFRNEVRDMIKSKEFDLVLIRKDYAPFAPVELPDYYQYLGEISAPVPHLQSDFPLTIWKPKP